MPLGLGAEALGTTVYYGLHINDNLLVTHDLRRDSNSSCRKECRNM